jgi:hypothetical protein
VLTIKVVLAAPFDGVTVAGLNEHEIPVTTEHENVTLFANPPDGVTVSMNCVDCPAVTVTLGGAAASAKSALAMLMVTAADVLPPNVSSPAYIAVTLCMPAANVLMVTLAAPVASRFALPKFVEPS